MKKINNIFIFYILMQIGNDASCLDKQKSTDENFNVGNRLFTRKGKLELEENLLYIQFDEKSLTSLENNLAYGFTRTFGVELSVTWVLQNSQKNKRRSGLGDLSLEAQWHFYSHIENLCSANVAIHFPGYTLLEPYFATYGWAFEIEGIHSSDTWYALSSCRIRINQRRNNEFPGNRLLYELTTGPKFNLKNKAKLHILADLDLVHDTKSKKFGKPIFDSGGTVILLGPLVSYNKGDLVIENGVQVPIAQHIPIDPKVSWVYNFTFGITF